LRASSRSLEAPIQYNRYPSARSVHRAARSLGVRRHVFGCASRLRSRSPALGGAGSVRNSSSRTLAVAAATLRHSISSCACKARHGARRFLMHADLVSTFSTASCSARWRSIPSVEFRRRLSLLCSGPLRSSRARAAGPDKNRPPALSNSAPRSRDARRALSRVSLRPSYRPAPSVGVVFIAWTMVFVFPQLLHCALRPRRCSSTSSGRIDKKMIKHRRPIAGRGSDAPASGDVAGLHCTRDDRSDPVGAVPAVWAGRGGGVMLSCVNCARSGGARVAIVIIEGVDRDLLSFPTI